MKLTKLKANQGFTLIEMLVVVAVIGILSSVLLNALGPAKQKAKDSRIQQELGQVRSLAETFYDGDYDALETIPKTDILNQNLRALSLDIALQGGELVIRKATPALNYIAYSRLNLTIGTSENPQTAYYCLDSTGNSGITTVDLSGRTSCPL